MNSRMHDTTQGGPRPRGWMSSPILGKTTACSKDLGSTTFSGSLERVRWALCTGNIHVTPQGIIKIRDFGLSVSPDPELAHPSSTPVYLAPELILGDEGGERADIFSAGVVFYELLTSVHPFHGRQGTNTPEG